MRKTILASMGAAFLCCASGCTEIPPTTYASLIWKGLAKNGLHVVDVTLLGSFDDDATLQSSHTYNSPSSVCFSAPHGAGFRAFDNTGKTVIGIACLEQDNTVSVPLQRTFS